MMHDCLLICFLIKAHAKIQLNTKKGHKYEKYEIVPKYLLTKLNGSSLDYEQVCNFNQVQISIS